MNRETITQLSDEYFKVMTDLVKAAAETEPLRILLRNANKIEGFKSAVIIMGGLELMEKVAQQWEEYYDGKQVQKQAGGDIQI